MRQTLRDLFPASRRSGDDDVTLHGSDIHNANSTSASSTDEKGRPEPARRKTHGDGRRELTRDDCEDEIGFGFSTTKKWVCISC